MATNMHPPYSEAVVEIRDDSVEKYEAAGWRKASGTSSDTKKSTTRKSSSTKSDDK